MDLGSAGGFLLLTCAKSHLGLGICGTLRSATSEQPQSKGSSVADPFSANTCRGLGMLQCVLCGPDYGKRHAAVVPSHKTKALPIGMALLGGCQC